MASRTPRTRPAPATAGAGTRAARCSPSAPASSPAGPPVSATTGPSTRSCAGASGRWARTSRSCRPSSSASASATSTPSGRPATASPTTNRAPGRWTRSSSRPRSSWAPIRRTRSRHEETIMTTRTLSRTLSPLIFVVVGLVTGLGAGPGEAASKIPVVATTTDLKALVEAVGGDLVDVDALARGTQNPHDLEVRPSLMVKVRRADLLVMNGLELDQWAEVVVQGAGNARVGPGAPGRIDASAGLLVLEVPQTRVDRSMGDVHPVGNPHYSIDPGMAAGVTAN